MPILPKEADIYPNDLLSSWESFCDGDPHWWVLYTLSRREKDLMRRLHASSVAYYGPLCARRNRTSSGRVRVSYVPLFPGYVFLCGGDEDRLEALKTNCISRVLPVSDPSALVRDLRSIHQLIESDAPLTTEARLQPGTPVRVKNGALVGVEGVVISRRGKDRLLVSVEFLQQGASVALDDFQVEPI